MSNVSQFYSKEDIQDQACLWISRIDRGLTSQEKQELVVWCRLSKTHHTTLLEMASFWDELSVVRELSGLFPLESAKKKSFGRIKGLPAVAKVACVALVSVLSLNTLLDDSFIPNIPSYNEWQLTQTDYFQTEIGEQQHFDLPDGSKIQLNTGSKVELVFNPKQRLIRLLEGEAKFDVAKDAHRPFTVEAGSKSFTALGTVFNVQKNQVQENSAASLELLVTEGRVLIANAEEDLDVIKAAFNQESNTLLSGVVIKAGQKADVISQHLASIHALSDEEIQRDLAWQQGMLVFDGEPLSQVLKDISRYTEARFQIADPNTAELKVAGFFKAGDIKGMLASLEANLNIAVINTEKNHYTLALNYH